MLFATLLPLGLPLAVDEGSLGERHQVPQTAFDSWIGQYLQWGG